MAGFLRDMFDGGGMGRSGQKFEGGPFSAILNALGVKPMGYNDRMAETRPQPRPSYGGGRLSARNAPPPSTSGNAGLSGPPLGSMGGAPGAETIGNARGSYLVVPDPPRGPAPAGPPLGSQPGAPGQQTLDRAAMRNTGGPPLGSQPGAPNGILPMPMNSHMVPARGRNPARVVQQPPQLSPDEQALLTYAQQRRAARGGLR